MSIVDVAMTLIMLGLGIMAPAIVLLVVVDLTGRKLVDSVQARIYGQAQFGLAGVALGFALLTFAAVAR
jgi:hypothetical protein